MTAIEIEKDVPVPASYPRGKDGIYPFKDLKVGESFVVELNGRRSWAFIYSAMNHAQNQHGIKLTTRLIDPDKRRIWRVA